MNPSHDPDLVALNRVTDRLTAAVDSILDDQWGRPTPCPDWDLTELVDHLTGGNWFTIRILAGDRAEDALHHTMARFDGGSASRSQATRSLGDQREGFCQPGILDETRHHMAGALSGRQILRLRLHDLIVHLWDIEQTLHPPATIADHLLGWGLAELADRDSLTATHFDLGRPSDSETGPDPGTIYLARFGR